MSITNLMIDEHKKIDEYLKKFLERFGEAHFKFFEEKLREHFGMEKGIIFTLTEKFLGKELNEIFKLKEQHKEILVGLANIRKKLPDGAKDLIQTLVKDLSAHTRYEEHFFYPKIDDMLDEEQKSEITQEIRKIL